MLPSRLRCSFFPLLRLLGRSTLRGDNEYRTPATVAAVTKAFQLTQGVRQPRIWAPVAVDCRMPTFLTLEEFLLFLLSGLLAWDRGGVIQLRKRKCPRPILSKRLRISVQFEVLRIRLSPALRPWPRSNWDGTNRKEICVSYSFCGFRVGPGGALICCAV